MDKPKEILDLEKELGFELTETSDEGEIPNWNKNKIYFLSEREVIGLNLNDCELSDISPLGNLVNLTELHLTLNKISDISSLSSLVNLKELNLSGNQLSDISSLSGLVNLNELSLDHNQISDISPLSGLMHLIELRLGHNQILDISPLSNLVSLTWLYLSGNQLSDISSLKCLLNLYHLDLSRNKISDISSLTDLSDLTQLYLRDNQIADISSLTSFFNLRILNLINNQISDIGIIERIVNNIKLQRLDLQGNPLPIPIEIINKHTSYLLEREIYKEDRKKILELRNYIQDLKKGKVGNQEAKIIFIGNGSVGKTQIANRLVGFDYQSIHESTHAISIFRQKIECNFVENGLWISYWDFGGQDIYHNTHRLFMQTRAVIVLVWDNENEKSSAHSHNNNIYDNYSLEYWLSYAHYFSPNSPILVVQNKIDEENAKYIPSETKQKYQEEYPQIVDFLEVSAEKKININVLQEKIKHTFENNLNIRAEIIKPIPKSWNNVLKATRFIEKFGYKKISKSFFTRLCRLNNVRKSTNTILSYLHNIGALYYKEGYFSDKIILRQDWAIQAIYKILDRETQYFNLLHHAQENDKKISYSYLKEKVWTENTDKECELFLDFMQSAELCYEATPKDTPLKNKEYVIPQLLPLSPKEDLESYAKARNLIHEDKINYRFLPPSLIQRFMVTIQNEVTIISLWQKGLIIKQENSIVIIESIISKDRTLQYISLIYNEEAKNGFIEKIKEHFKILEGESPVKITKSENGFDAIRYGREQMFGIEHKELQELNDTPQLNPTQMQNEKFITYLSESTNTDIPDLLFAIKKQYEEMPSSKRGTFNQLKDEFENPPNNFQLNGWKARLKVFISGLDFEINYPNQKTTQTMSYGADQEIKGLKEVVELVLERKTFFLKEYERATTAKERFALEYDLKEMEKKIADYRQQIQKLKGENPSNSDLKDLDNKTQKAQEEIEESLKEEKKTSVFISYNHKDKITANKIKDFLRIKEIDVTIDSEAMGAGEDIKTFIEKCVRENDITLSLVSENSLLSAWVAMESVLTFAGEKIASKKFIAVYEDDSFFDDSFVRIGTLEIRKERTKLDVEIDECRKLDIPTNSLQGKATRLRKLESNLSDVIERLRNSLCIDIGGNNFENGMQKICDDIK